jgi:hypothetical protein
MRKLWQRFRDAWRASAERLDELAVEEALRERELRDAESGEPEERLPPLQSNTFGPV